MAASDDSEKAYLQAYAVGRQAADAVDGLVGNLNSAASNFDRGRAGSDSISSRRR
jgi:hypothetical protein